MKTYLTLLLLLILSGCALLVPKGSYFSESNEIDFQEGKAVVYLYRVGNQYASKAGSVNIYIDDKKVFGVVDRAYTVVNLKPNKYVFKANWSWYDKPLFESGLYDEKKLTLTVISGKEYFINYRVQEVDSSGYDGFGLLGKAAEPRSSDASVDLVQESKVIGIKNLERSRYQENLLSK